MFSLVAGCSVQSTTMYTTWNMSCSNDVHLCCRPGRFHSSDITDQNLFSLWNNGGFILLTVTIHAGSQCFRLLGPLSLALERHQVLKIYRLWPLIQTRDWAHSSQDSSVHSLSALSWMYIFTLHKRNLIISTFNRLNNNLEMNSGVTWQVQIH
jgi:hypothetical protein